MHTFVFTLSQIRNGNGKIPAEDKDWEELSDEQKKAAELLGMDEDEWDDSDDEGPRYEDVDWKHLRPDVKAAATELGYTQEMWDSESSGKKLAIEDKDWDELSQKERDLLMILGYNEDLVSQFDCFWVRFMESQLAVF